MADERASSRCSIAARALRSIILVGLLAAAGSTRTAALTTNSAPQSYSIRIGADGGTLVMPPVTLVLPPGAVSDSATITVDTVPPAPSVYRLVPMTVVDLGLDRRAFSSPVEILIHYDDAAIPAGVPENSLRLHKLVEGVWTEVDGSTVDSLQNFVSASVLSFSVYSVLGASVEQVRISPGAASVAIGDTARLTAVVTDMAGNELPNRPVSWSSQDIVVAAVDTMGLVRGMSEGRTTITATSEGESGTAIITVVAQPVASVTVVPATANLAIGGTVQLEAFARDADGSDLPDRQVEWSSTDESVASATSQGLVTGVSEGETTITATSEGESGSATVIVGEAGDLIVADHETTTPTPQTVALVDGAFASGDCWRDEVRLFDEQHVLTNLTGGCDPEPAEVAVFSEDRAMGLEVVEWTEGTDVVDASELPGMLTVPVAMWIAVDDPTAPESVETVAQGLLINTANDIYSDNRTGVQFSLTGGAATAIEPRTVEGLDWYTDPACEQIDFDTLFLQADGENLVPAIDLSLRLLNIVFVDEIWTAHPDNPAAFKGYYCLPTEDRVGALAFVSWNDGASSTVAHELGHVLSLLTPYSGHTHLLHEFDCTNVMYWMRDDCVAPRDHLSLGQSYRINAEVTSWLNHAVYHPYAATSQPIRSGEESRVCQCDPDANVPCPRLSQDVSVAPVTPSGKMPCNDRIELAGPAVHVPEDHRAAALLTGRLWRTGECEAYIPGIPAEDNDRRVMLFPNLVRSGPSCDSRAALFFRDHAVHWFDIQDDEETWTYDVPERLYVEVESGTSLCGLSTIDCITSIHANRLTVPVYLWPEKDLQSAAESDMAVVSQLFEDEFSGIELTIESSTQADAGTGSDLCSPGAGEQTNPGKSINVYYVSAIPSSIPAVDAAAIEAHGGHSSCGGDGRYVVTVLEGLSSTKALAHHLGHVFGLADVTSPSDLEASLETAQSNVMWHVPSDGADLHFTLGQIFRMNFHEKSWIQSDDSDSMHRDITKRVDCDATPSVCPAVDRDGSR